MIRVLFLLPILLIAEYKTVFHETWDDNSRNWFLNDTSYLKQEISEGKYLFHNKYDKTQSIWLNNKWAWRSPYKISIEATHLSGIDNQSFGLFWGGTSPTNGFRFGISKNGYFIIYYYKKGEYKELKGWTKVEPGVINSDTKNILELEYHSGLHFYYINGNLVHTHDSKVPFGYDIGCFVSDQQKIAYDNLKIQVDSLPPINVIFDADSSEGKINLGKNVNTEFSERAQYITPDGKRLYFSRYLKNSYGQIKGDIYYSDRNDDDKFSPAKAMPFPINNEDNNNLIASSTDGNTLLLAGKYSKDGKKVNKGVSKTVKTKNGWAIPTEQIIDSMYNTHKRFSNYFMSSNRNYFLSSVEMDQGYGDLDIYVSFLKKDGSYSMPINLGEKINTIGRDFSAFLASDNKTLYFASYGHSGYGSSDIYMSKRLDSTWQNWSEPKNLGPGINTKRFDAYLSLDAKGEYAYLVSSNQSIGSEDIFKIKLPKSARPEAVLLVSGKILNVKDSTKLEADILIEDIETGENLATAKSDPETGEYVIILQRGVKYSFNPNLDGFYPGSEFVDLSEISEYKEIKLDLYLTPLEVGSKIKLNNLFFDYNKASLQENSFVELNRLAEILKTNPKMKILIGGHTDSRGDDDYNYNLSEERAKSVQEYLISKGIDNSRLSYKGFGKSVPVAKNDSEENMAKNRRVEFEILEN